ncbi:plastocyanin/azurin family copper-binding protein [Natribaculum luteum]|uniref:Plastocyanin/azurin family copper-binding protein n=1 Tax=Natribaculum luteum TaxID=1586232 RepID=A0ABD5NVJ4_9EURY|nr:plastocyanin/azurin family copper-binding protein [Natribaculum luteum]
MTDHSRRQFLRALGASAVASTGLTQSATAQETPVVEMGNNYFDPIGLYVEPGATVRFEIEAGSHSATAYPDRIPSDATAFDSGTISEGSFEQTFETPGTYDYYCIPHESVGMVGRIVVDSPGGPAEESPIPYGDVPESETIVDQGTAGVSEGSTGDGDTGGGMMGSGRGPGMMNGRNGGWGSGLPFVGSALGVLGVIGGVLYWARHRKDTRSENTDSAMTTLRRQYARGEIDEDEFQRRRERLQDRENG